MIVINESERSELPDKAFGIPEERKYPLHDEKHVRSAIKLFNHVEPKYENELAGNIIRKMKKYNISASMVGSNNRLKKYIPDSMLEAYQVYRQNLVFDFGDVLVDCRYRPRAFTYTKPLLIELKAKGYKLYYLSNWDKDSCEGFIKDGTFDFINLFDGGIFSWEVDMEKPVDNIYKVFLNKYNLMAKDCIFFDDKYENICMARETGMGAIQFNHASTPLYIINTFLDISGLEDGYALIKVLEQSEDKADSKIHLSTPVNSRRFSNSNIKNEDFLSRNSKPAKNQKVHLSYLKQKIHNNKTNGATDQKEMPDANKLI